MHSSGSTKYSRQVQTSDFWTLYTTKIIQKQYFGRSLSTYNLIDPQNAQKWQFVWAYPLMAFPAPRMIFFSSFPLKSLYLRAFWELWPCFFLISGREGKWCFFVSCKASGCKKSLMPRGSAAQGFVVYYDIFSLLFPSYLRSRRSAGVSFWGSTGVGRDRRFLIRTPLLPGQRLLQVLWTFSLLLFWLFPKKYALHQNWLSYTAHIIRELHFHSS